MSKKLC